jgi:hypothetical protein
VEKRSYLEVSTVEIQSLLQYFYMYLVGYTNKEVIMQFIFKESVDNVRKTCMFCHTTCNYGYIMRAENDNEH